MIILLFILSLFSVCEVKVDEIVPILDKSSFQLYRIIGDFNLDGNVSENITLVIPYNCKNMFNQDMFFISLSDLDNKMYKCVSKRTIVFPEDFEDLIRDCCCNRLNRFIEWYINYNSNLYKDGYSIPRSGM